MSSETVKLTFDGRVMQIARGALLSSVLSVDAPCGGHGRCGKCRVIARGALSPASDTERRLLSEEDLARGVRLACLTYAEGDCEVTREESHAAKILSDGESAPITLSPVFARYGVAIDIGTTTLAARLYDRSGASRAERTRLNPQSRWGADVISRIEASLRGEGDALARAVREALDLTVAELAADAGISEREIDRAVITGNTAMLHLLTETSVEPLSRAPFEAGRLFGETLSAAELGLASLSPDTKVYLPPCISAFVGADMACALLASGICRKETASLLVDIGTNGEMALSVGDHLRVCSTAAGPAFEGVGISMGMRGADGAIDSVRLVNGSLFAHVIGGGSPIGICGSGLIDAIACLLDSEELDETGYLEDEEATVALPVVLTQADIRAVQLAKSAICAGLESLLVAESREADDVSRFYVAGGFGSYLDMKSAERIGLVPQGFAQKTTVMGNAALAGASMLLLDSSCTRECKEIASRAETLELATNPVFVEKYMQGMLF